MSALTRAAMSAAVSESGCPRNSAERTCFSTETRSIARVTRTGEPTSGTGFDNIPRGQWEASTALNLSTWTTFRDIIVPQIIPPIVPALGNYLVALFKETPLLSAIAVLELMQTAKIMGSETFRYTEPMTLVGLFFLAMSLASAALIRATETAIRRRMIR